MNHLKRMTHWFRAPSYDREIAAYAEQSVFSRGHSPLAAFEGLFLASLFSVVIWSVLTFVLVSA